MMIKEKLKSIFRAFYRFLLQNTPNRILFRKNIRDIEKFDKVHGTNFGGRIYQDELGVSKERANDYSPSPTSELLRIMRSGDIKQTDSIVDLGCGKGYAMYLISKFPILKLGG